MKLRHIIVEGCDGTGKTTLINELLEYKQHGQTEPYFTMHERASRSQEGPVDALDTWVEKDLAGIDTHPPSVYDRHPLISEPIYGPVCRGMLPGKFNDGLWQVTARSRLARYSLVIWCVPPWNTVRNNLVASAHNQMAGVIINARRIYDMYSLASKTWPGVSMRYDYTNPARTIGAYVSLVFGGR